VWYGQRDDFVDAQASAWVAVTAAQDGVHQFPLSGLPPNSLIYVRVECRSSTGTPSPSIITGQFRTAPVANEDVPITGVILGCHLYQKLDHPDGLIAYHSVAQLKPHFIVQTGDNVYYDRDIGPFSTTIPLARWQWQRMFSLPRHRTVFENIASYWEKDDHDTLRDDSWPGKTFGTMTFADGLAIFKSQVPSSPLPYRTFRWGQHVQIWLMEGRDYRSANSDPDGPEKSIWGAEQKAWLKKTMQDSDASWKILISPTPIVGPDRPKKNDNHANVGFQHEGDEIRAWLKEQVADQVIVVNGDRHWQYHSVFPPTGLHEFSTGPTSDGLAEGTPGENKEFHRFHRVKGGFLSFTAEEKEKQPRLSVRHHAIDGMVVHEQVFTRPR
jgi:alkaline phosphatase D